MGVFEGSGVPPGPSPGHEAADFALGFGAARDRFDACALEAQSCLAPIAGLNPRRRPDDLPLIERCLVLGTTGAKNARAALKLMSIKVGSFRTVAAGFDGGWLEDATLIYQAAAAELKARESEARRLALAETASSWVVAELRRFR